MIDFAIDTILYDTIVCCIFSEAMNDARHSQVRESRLSVRYQAKEMSSGRVSSRRSSATVSHARW